MKSGIMNSGTMLVLCKIVNLRKGFEFGCNVNYLSILSNAGTTLLDLFSDFDFVAILTEAYFY